MKRFVLLAALAATIASVFTPGSTASAQTDPAPELFNSFVGCYRSLIQTDDLFCITRYQLPTNDTAEPVAAEAWCQYLLDQDGCIGNPVQPTAPWSLMAGAAFIALYDGGVLLGQTQVPRIGYSMGGVYFPAGHGIVWEDPAIEGCVESSATIFTTFEQVCLPVFWNTADNTQEAQRDILGRDLISQFFDLEVQDPLIPPNGYVNNTLISNEGRDIALEMLNVIDRILPDTFRSQSLPAITEGFATPTGDLQLQQDIDATATAFVGALQGTGTSFGLSGDAVGIGLFTIMGLVAFTATYRFTSNNFPMAVVAFLTTMLTGVPIGAVPVTVAAVAGVLIFFVGGFFILKKLGVT